MNWAVKGKDQTNITITAMDMDDLFNILVLYDIDKVNKESFYMIKVCKYWKKSTAVTIVYLIDLVLKEVEWKLSKSL